MKTKLLIAAIVIGSPAFAGDYNVTTYNPNGTIRSTGYITPPAQSRLQSDLQQHLAAMEAIRQRLISQTALSVARDQQYELEKQTKLLQQIADK